MENRSPLEPLIKKPKKKFASIKIKKKNQELSEKLDQIDQDKENSPLDVFDSLIEILVSKDYEKLLSNKKTISKFKNIFDDLTQKTANNLLEIIQYIFSQVTFYNEIGTEENFTKEPLPISNTQIAIQNIPDQRLLKVRLDDSAEIIYSNQLTLIMLWHIFKHENFLLRILSIKFWMGVLKNSFKLNDFVTTSTILGSLNGKILISGEYKKYLSAYDLSIIEKVDELFKNRTILTCLTVGDVIPLSGSFKAMFVKLSQVKPPKFEKIRKLIWRLRKIQIENDKKILANPKSSKQIHFLTKDFIYQVFEKNFSFEKMIELFELSERYRKDIIQYILEYNITQIYVFYENLKNKASKVAFISLLTKSFNGMLTKKELIQFLFSPDHYQYYLQNNINFTGDPQQLYKFYNETKIENEKFFNELDQYVERLEIDILKLKREKDLIMLMIEYEMFLATIATGSPITEKEVILTATEETPSNTEKEKIPLTENEMILAAIEKTASIIEEEMISTALEKLISAVEKARAENEMISAANEEREKNLYDELEKITVSIKDLRNTQLEPNKAKNLISKNKTAFFTVLSYFFANGIYNENLIYFLLENYPDHIYALYENLNDVYEANAGSIIIFSYNDTRKSFVKTLIELASLEQLSFYLPNLIKIDQTRFFYEKSEKGEKELRFNMTITTLLEVYHKIFYTTLAKHLSDSLMRIDINVIIKILIKFSFESIKVICAKAYSFTTELSVDYIKLLSDLIAKETDAARQKNLMGFQKMILSLEDNGENLFTEMKNLANYFQREILNLWGHEEVEKILQYLKNCFAVTPKIIPVIEFESIEGDLLLIYDEYHNMKKPTKPVKKYQLSANLPEEDKFLEIQTIFSKELDAVTSLKHSEEKFITAFSKFIEYTKFQNSSEAQFIPDETPSALEKGRQKFLYYIYETTTQINGNKKINFLKELIAIFKNIKSLINPDSRNKALTLLREQLNIASTNTIIHQVVIEMLDIKQEDISKIKEDYIDLSDADISLLTDDEIAFLSMLLEENEKKIAVKKVMEIQKSIFSKEVDAVTSLKHPEEKFISAFSKFIEYTKSQSDPETQFILYTQRKTTSALEKGRQKFLYYIYGAITKINGNKKIKFLKELISILKDIRSLTNAELKNKALTLLRRQLNIESTNTIISQVVIEILLIKKEDIAKMKEDYTDLSDADISLLSDAEIELLNILQEEHEKKMVMKKFVAQLSDMNFNILIQYIEKAINEGKIFKLKLGEKEITLLKDFKAGYEQKIGDGHREFSMPAALKQKLQKLDSNKPVIPQEELKKNMHQNTPRKISLPEEPKTTILEVEPNKSALLQEELKPVIPQRKTSLPESPKQTFRLSPSVVIPPPTPTNSPISSPPASPNTSRLFKPVQVNQIKRIKNTDPPIKSASHPDYSETHYFAKRGSQ